MRVEKGTPLMWIKYILLFFIGAAGGGLIAAGLFAFITMVGVVTRLATRTKTANHIMLFEDTVILGAFIGNILYVYHFSLPIGGIGLILFGFFSGVYVGCLAVALAEVINAIPVFARRTKIQMGMPYIVCSMAFAKAVGSFIQLYLNAK